MTFLPVHGSFRRLHVARGSGLDFDEAEDILVPADPVNLPMVSSCTVIPRNHHIAESPQIEISVFFAAPSSVLMSGAFGIPIGRDPVNRPNCQLSEAAGKHRSKLRARARILCDVRDKRSCEFHVSTLLDYDVAPLATLKSLREPNNENGPFSGR